MPKMPKFTMPKSLSKLGAAIKGAANMAIGGIRRGVGMVSHLLSPIPPEQEADKEKKEGETKEEKTNAQSQSPSATSPQQAGLKEGLEAIFNIVSEMGSAVGDFLSKTAKLVKDQMPKSKAGQKDQDVKPKLETVQTDKSNENKVADKDQPSEKTEKDKKQKQEAKSDKKENPLMSFLKLLGNLLMRLVKAPLFVPETQQQKPQTSSQAREQKQDDNDDKDAAANKGALKIVPAPSLGKVDNFANDMLSSLKRSCYRKATAEQTADGGYKFGLGKDNGDMTINADKTRINLSNCNEKSLAAAMQAASKISGGLKAGIDISGIPKGQLDNAWLAAKQAGLKPTGYKPTDGSDVRKQWGEEKDFMKQQVSQNANLNRKQERQDNNNQMPKPTDSAKPKLQ